MMVLPIVERELRLAARQGSTYWLRVGIALVAGLVLLGNYLAVQAGWLNAARAGKNFSDGLAGFAFACCLFAGLITTADSISREKRERTLGFLFLTDLRSYDVVFGKCFATSLAPGFTVVTIFPVLGLSLLFGGVTGGEFWRMTLVLLTTFLFSIATGICISTISKDAQKAIASTFAVLLVFALVWPACGYVLLEHTKWSGLGLFLSFLIDLLLFGWATNKFFTHFRAWAVMR